MFEKLPESIGRSLRQARPGLGALACHDPVFADVPETIELTSSGFLNGETLPARFTADGAGVSPPLQWRGAPEGTVSLALIVEDADSPTPEPLVHAIAWGLGPNGGIAEGALGADDGPMMGRNSYLRMRYLPPDPPPGHGPHRYVFQLFAVDHALEFWGAPGRAEMLRALCGHTLAIGTLTGTTERLQRSNGLVGPLIIGVGVAGLTALLVNRIRKKPD
jgi:Raf kinase inhibitor-like YbhB/YbcL family protein